MIEERYIAKLKELRTALADDALFRPKKENEFEYGVACGTNIGLRLAEEKFLALLSEGEDEHGSSEGGLSSATTRGRFDER